MDVLFKLIISALNNLNTSKPLVVITIDQSLIRHIAILGISFQRTVLKKCSEIRNSNGYQEKAEAT